MRWSLSLTRKSLKREYVSLRYDYGLMLMYAYALQIRQCRPHRYLSLPLE
jgi:hypothetical protein